MPILYNNIRDEILSVTSNCVKNIIIILYIFY